MYTYFKTHESEYATKKNLCTRVDEKKLKRPCYYLEGQKIHLAEKVSPVL